MIQKKVQALIWSQIKMCDMAKPKDADPSPSTYTGTFIERPLDHIGRLFRRESGEEETPQTIDEIEEGTALINILAQNRKRLKLGVGTVESHQYKFETNKGEELGPFARFGTDIPDKSTIFYKYISTPYA